MNKYLTGLIILVAFTKPGKCQSPFAALQNLFTTPNHYIVTYTHTAPNIDGDINDGAWAQAAWSNSFTDIEGDAKPKPQYNTQLKMLWDDKALYIAVKMEEPHLWAKLTHHDDIIFQDNDFEAFFDPDNDGRNYFEVEVNQLNQIFDLFLPKPYRNHGDALISWDTPPGMRTAVKLQGTLNKSTDKDKGWTVELCIPFKALAFGFRNITPIEGTIWRADFSRVEWDTKIENGNYVKLTNDKGKTLPERNWVWSVPGLISMHYPERWGYLQFTKNTNAAASANFTVPYSDLQRQYLWLIYYNEQKYHEQHRTYTDDLKLLGLNETTYNITGKLNTLSISGTKHQFTAGITDADGRTSTINEDGLVK